VVVRHANLFYLPLNLFQKIEIYQYYMAFSISLNKEIDSNTVLRYTGKPRSSDTRNPSNLLKRIKNLSFEANISDNPLISTKTVFNCSNQFSSFSFIGINFQS
jgi:hypothetical protein